MTYMIADIEKAVCIHFQLTRKLIRSPQSWRSVARPRQIAMYLAREITQASYPQIARHFNRDYSTARYGARRVGKLLQTTNTMAGEVEGVRAVLHTLTPMRQQIGAAVLLAVRGSA